jgi:hypothetical protein
MTRACWKDAPLRDLMRLACAGESWQMIGVAFYPKSTPWRAKKAAREVFHRHATEADCAARRQALALHNFNKPPGLSRRSTGRDTRWRRHSLEVGTLVERVDPFAGMGRCFA